MEKIKEKFNENDNKTILQNNFEVTDIHSFAIEKKYKYWRRRILASITIGYAMFYFLRQNFSMATISLQDFFHVSKAQIGLILSIHSIIYGVGKALWSFVSDKSNARYFMTIGLFFSSIANICVGFSNHLTVIGIFWVINACFLSMGSSPCIKLLTYWYTKRERATKWAFWNASQQIGAASSVMLCGYLLVHYGWRYIFLVPGIIGITMSIFLFMRLRDTPTSMGLPTIEDFKGVQDQASQICDTMTVKEIVVQKLIKNPLIWVLCFANMFFYIFRIGILNWAPTFLRELKGCSLQLAGFQTALFDLSSVIGGILAGIASDKLLGGKRTPLCIFSMVSLAILMCVLFYIPPHSRFVQIAIMILMGALITSPQILVGVAAADFSSKKVAGTANGFTGIFGYIGASVSGVGVGLMVERFGWHVAFFTFVASAILSAILFYVVMKISRHK